MWLLYIISALDPLLNLMPTEISRIVVLSSLMLCVAADCAIYMRTGYVLYRALVIQKYYVNNNICISCGNNHSWTIGFPCVIRNV